MKAARYHLTGSSYVLQCDDTPVPDCRPGEARVRVAFCGICGSDLARYRQIADPPDSLRKLYGGVSFIQGHEFSGVVDQIGPGLPARGYPDLEIGTRVAVHPLVGCRECAECRRQEWNLCRYPERSQVIGVHRDGGLAEWVTVPADHLVPLGERVTLQAAALTEPLAVALHAVNIAQIPDVELPVTIIGDGTLGLLITLVLKHRGQREIRLIGRHPGRLELGRRMGAVLRADGEGRDWSAAPVRYVFQVAGASAALEQGLELLSVTGHMICLGYLDSMSAGIGPIPFNGLIRNQKCIRGSFGSSLAEFARAVRGLDSGEYDVTPLLDTIVSLDRIAEAFDVLLQDPRPAGKILVAPGPI